MVELAVQARERQSVPVLRPPNEQPPLQLRAHLTPQIAVNAVLDHVKTLAADSPRDHAGHGFFLLRSHRQALHAKYCR